MKLKSLRESKNLTQQQLADQIGVTRSAVAMWESQGFSPRADLLPVLAKIFDCKIDELFESSAV